MLTHNAIWLAGIENDSSEHMQKRLDTTRVERECICLNTVYCLGFHRSSSIQRQQLGISMKVVVSWGCFDGQGCVDLISATSHQPVFDVIRLYLSEVR